MARQNMQTKFDTEIIVESDAESHRGETLVTMWVAGESHALFAAEARQLAEYLIEAANAAEMV